MNDFFLQNGNRRNWVCGQNLDNVTETDDGVTVVEVVDSHDSHHLAAGSGAAKDVAVKEYYPNMEGVSVNYNFNGDTVGDTHTVVSVAFADPGLVNTVFLVVVLFLH